MENLPIIGIDLGTTNSCVATVVNGQVKMLEIVDGKRTMPSYVAFTEEGRFIGFEAKEVSHKYYESTIYDTKRLMGKKYYDEEVQRDIKLWPFKVANDGGNPIIGIKINDEEKTFTAEEIAAMIIQKLKQIAEIEMKVTVTQAVITVPAYFNDAQRQATKDAGSIAGVKVLKVLNEPTAAAIAYGWENKSDVARKILIFDLGGGTFDVSIVNVDGGLNEVIGTDGDTHLGGSDFDTTLVNYFANIYKEKFGKDLIDDKYSIRRMRAKCEELKIKLSQVESSEVEFESLYAEDFYSSITREQFEKLNEEAFAKTLEIVSRCLETCEIQKEEIDDVVLIGGSTRIPMIKQLITDYFGKEPSKTINPDEAVAMGAAIQAVILGGDKSETFQDIKIEDVTSMAFGTSVQGGLMSIVIKQNVKIPTEAKKHYFTIRDQQRVMDFPIYQGNRALVTDNFELGEFSIADLTPDLPGKVKVEATFKIDENGILSVTATEVATGKNRSVNIDIKKKGLSDEKIAAKTAEAERMAEEDLKKKEFISAKNDLEAFCIKMKSSVVYAKYLDGHKKKTVKDKCDETIRWLDELKDGELDTIREKHEEVKEVCQPIVDEI